MSQSDFPHRRALLHALCVMFNHWHGVVADRDARLHEFLEIAAEHFL
jgi:hypothetical protein